jgi:oligogalacturonide transport system ATP-binding protein
VGGRELALPAARLPQGRQGPVKFGLRPEHIALVPFAAGGVSAPAALRFAEHMGNEVFVHADIGGVPFTARVPAAQADGLQAQPRGSALTLHLQMDAAHLFDANTGAALG